MSWLSILLSLTLAAPCLLADEAADLAAARAVFDRNITAIQERDREAYLSCYRPDARLVRAGADGFDLGFEPLAAGTPATGDDSWPDALIARDVSLSWIGEGLVYGTYRYTTWRGSEVASGLSERLFQRTNGEWFIVVTTAFEAGDGTLAPPIALVGGTVHDGTGEARIDDAVVLLRDGRIEAVGPAASVQVPDGVDVVDVAGKHLTPGLVDTHVHYSQTGWADGRPDARDMRDRYPYHEAMAALEAHPERFHRAFLHSGITAVFDVGGYPWTRRLGERTELAADAPHVVATGALFSTFDVTREALGAWLPDARQFVYLAPELRVEEAVRGHLAAGSDAIKIWYVIRTPGDVERHRPLVEQVFDAAASVGLPVVVHATQLETARVAVELGARLLVHSVEDRLVDEAFVQAAAAAGVFYCPTLTVRDGYTSLRHGELTDELQAQLDAVHPSIAARVRETTELTIDARMRSPAARAASAERDERAARTMAENLRRLHAAGVPIVMGTDAGNPLTLHGPSVFPELEAMGAAGLPPSDVLRAATFDAARAIGRGDDLGRIVPGAIADILVLGDDPTVAVTHWRSLEAVVRAGTYHLREHLRP